MEAIDDLIGKVLAGEASPQEQKELDAWLGESESNRKYFDQLKTIFGNAGAPSIQLHFDTDAAWQRVRSKLEKKPGTRVLDNYFWRIAAAVTMVAIGGYFIYRISSPAIQRDEVRTVAQTVQDTLPDGSRAFLNRHSQIRFEYNHRKGTRNVVLTGEAYFEVKHEQEKPFIIETEQVLIRDIGTAFNVKAYPENQTVEVVVEEGEVQFYTKADSGVNVRRGETGIYDKALRKFSKIIKADTNVLSYKTKVFSFNNTDLGTVVQTLNEAFGAQIKLAHEGLSQCHLTVNFNDDSLETVVDVLAETLSLTVVRQGDQIILDGKGCN